MIEITFDVFIRVQKDCLAFDALLPQEVDALRVKGVCYLGNKMDWFVKSTEVSVTVRKPAEGSGNKEPDALEVVLNTGTTIPLKPGNKQQPIKKLIINANSDDI